jgi:2'-5' RNA ligase
LPPSIASVPPFVVHAHGYGFFAGHGSGDLNVHVPVVRNESLAAIHRVVLDATRNAGAVIAGWTEPDAWTPHMTVLSLARPDAPWNGCHVAGDSPPPDLADPVDRVVVTGGWTERSATSVPIPLGP